MNTRDMLQSSEAMGCEDPTMKTPPNSLETEQAALGCMLINHVSLIEGLNQLTEEDFYYRAHQLIFDAMAGVLDDGMEIDIVTVSEKLKSMDRLTQIGGRSYINNLALSVTHTQSFEYYCRILRDYRIRRGLLELGWTSLTLAHQKKTNDSLAKVQQKIIDISSQSDSQKTIIPIDEAVEQVEKEIDWRIKNPGVERGIRMGWPDLDFILNGIRGGQVVVVAARPSMGKTTFILNTVEYQALSQIHPMPTLFFSCEMTREQLIEKIICSHANIDGKKLDRGEITQDELYRIRASAKIIAKSPLYIDEKNPISVAEMRVKAKKIMIETGGRLGLIAIDYLQLLEGDGENRNLEIGEIMSGLKSMAKELRIPIVILSQLSRSVDSRADKKPQLSDLRDSGTIEQDADTVIFLYRDEYYTKGECQRPGIADIIVAKNRMGTTGVIELRFVGKYSRFENVQ